MSSAQTRSEHATPTSSAGMVEMKLEVCSIIFGKGVTTAVPGSIQDLMLIVSDIEAARAALICRGVDVSEVFHDVGGVSITPEPMDACRARTRKVAPTAHGRRSATQTATAGCSRNQDAASRKGVTATCGGPIMDVTTLTELAAKEAAVHMERARSGTTA